MCPCACAGDHPPARKVEHSSRHARKCRDSRKCRDLRDCRDSRKCRELDLAKRGWAPSDPDRPPPSRRGRANVATRATVATRANVAKCHPCGASGEGRVGSVCRQGDPGFSHSLGRREPGKRAWGACARMQTQRRGLHPRLFASPARSGGLSGALQAPRLAPRWGFRRPPTGLSHCAP